MKTKSKAITSLSLNEDVVKFIKDNDRLTFENRNVTNFTETSLIQLRDLLNKYEKKVGKMVFLSDFFKYLEEETGLTDQKT